MVMAVKDLHDLIFRIVRDPRMQRAIMPLKNTGINIRHLNGPPAYSLMMASSNKSFFLGIFMTSYFALSSPEHLIRAQKEVVK